MKTATAVLLGFILAAVAGSTAGTGQQASSSAPADGIDRTVLPVPDPRDVPPKPTVAPDRSRRPHEDHYVSRAKDPSEVATDTSTPSRR